MSLLSQGGKTMGDATVTNLTLCALGVLFIALKLTNVITWSWWFVTLPFWGITAIFLLIFLIVGVSIWFASVINEHHG